MEFSQLGWNMLTVGVIGTFVMAIVNAWGLRHQARKIRVRESTESLSVMQFVYVSCFLTASIIYGISISKATLIVNGLIVLCAIIPVLRQLIRVGGLSQTGKLTWIFLGGLLVVMIILPHKGAFYILFQLGSVMFTVAQPWKLVKNKRRGAVEHRLLIVSCCNSLFWLIFGISIDNKIIMTSATLGLLTHVIALLLWLRYKPEDHNVMNK